MIPEKAKFIIPIMNTFKIDTPLRQAHFLSNVMHESGDFRFKEENLNYSASGLLKVFPKYFTLETAKEYARKPDLIASRVYANRYGNGDEASKDGWNFRGRGYIQVTFRDNYRRFGKWAEIDAEKYPDRLTTPEYASLSAIWFWNSKNLNDYADEGSDKGVIEAIRKVINGGLNGIEDVTKRFNDIYEAV